MICHYTSKFKCLIPGLFAIIVANGCRPVEAPALSLQSRAQMAVLHLANALKVGDQACADEINVMENSEDAVALGEACIAAIEKGRDALLVAESLMSVWDDMKVNSIACSVVDGLKSLEKLDSVLKDSGAKIPNEIQDAITVANWIAPVCEKKDGG